MRERSGQSAMSYCHGCGHQLGTGRFCTGCGRPVTAPAEGVGGPVLGDPDSTAQRLPRIIVPSDTGGGRAITTGGQRAVGTGGHAVLDGPGPDAAGGVDRSWFSGTAVTAPDAATGARFPLYADEVDAVAAEGHATSWTTRAATPAAAPAPAASYDDPAPHPPDRPRRRRFLPALVVALALLLVVAIVGGALLLTGGTDDRETAGGTGTSEDRGDTGDDTGGDTDGAGDPGTGGDAVEVADPRLLDGLAQVEASATGRPGADVAGDPVAYDAANVLDGDPSTAWRIEGDGTGTTLTFTFDEPVAITSVGMINGYAKTDRGADGTIEDWYAQNRVVTEARWDLGDGDVVEQDLGRDTQAQRIDVATVVTRTITLTIAGVSDAAGRDNTPISEVELFGAVVSELD